jgi:tyrosyl-tRNA synthetase
MTSPPLSAEIEKQVEALMFGSEYGDPELARNMRRELGERLTEAQKSGQPLRVYCGYDPSRPDLHIGHAITMRRLRLFQDMGHHVIFLIGTFTALVGDTSDKATGRPRKTMEEVQEAARTYAEQAFRILDRNRTEVLQNGDWLSKITLADVISLASNFTVQQFLARHNYKIRIENGNPVGLHEFLYALMQGYDAVELRADVQLGATEQLFNIMAGRKLQEVYGQRPCVCLTFPILVGTDGKARMAKSAGNTIGLNDSAEDQFGKIMSLSDETMLEFVKYVTRWEPERIERFRKRFANGEHPMELKKELAFEVAAAYHGEEAARAAQQSFEALHQRHEVPTQMPELRLDGARDIVSVLVEAQVASSRSDARRLIQGKGVRLDGDVVEDLQRVVDRSAVLGVGKRRFVRLLVG